ncbi:hypothetical protein [Streptomyces sp. NPDC093097]|uniref:hypothetical protein n=1 Tax=Streptomyces sp. NPDC093097 TaxID=3366027 RepID=UPI00381B5C0E
MGGAATRGGAEFIDAVRGVWWMVLVLGLGIVALGLLSTGRRAGVTAVRAAALFEEVDRGADLRTTAPHPARPARSVPPPQ